ncbi:serine hydrolase domain-containing protein [Dermatophilaceae bacterium Sec6.4]
MTVIIDTRIRSITKTVTGTVLMQLAQRGKLSLDDTTGKYVPGVLNGDEITLRQLADMTSGVASYTQSTTFYRHLLRQAPDGVHPAATPEGWPQRVAAVRPRREVQLRQYQQRPAGHGRPERDRPGPRSGLPPTLTDHPRELVCSSPAVRIFVALSTALGHTFTPPQQH